MKFTLDDITVVICNWMQARFTLGAVKNIRKYFPKMPVIVVDDGSLEEKKSDFNRAYAREAYCAEQRFDNDMEKLRKGASELNFKLIELPEHIGHGSSIDYGLDCVKTPLMLTMDNDIRLLDDTSVNNYLKDINSAPDVYNAGTSLVEEDYEHFKFAAPCYGLYRVAPIRDLHLTFSNFILPILGKKAFHIGTGAFLHIMLAVEGILHRPKRWTAIHYPSPDYINGVYHLRKFKSDKKGDERFDKWEELIDG